MKQPYWSLWCLKLLVLRVIFMVKMLTEYRIVHEKNIFNIAKGKIIIWLISFCCFECLGEFCFILVQNKSPNRVHNLCPLECQRSVAKSSATFCNITFTVFIRISSEFSYEVRHLFTGKQIFIYSYLRFPFFTK